MVTASDVPHRFYSNRLVPSHTSCSRVDMLLRICQKKALLPLLLAGNSDYCEGHLADKQDNLQALDKICLGHSCYLLCCT